ncbi:MAG: hypothetical protein H8E66_16450 [Planctomycetes bacterium]|nr:hypothetical protein [Planctomycetota bacterium]
MAEPDELDDDDVKEQIKNLTRKIRKTPDRAALYVKRGICFGVLGQGKSVLKDFDKAMELGLKPARVFMLRGDSYFDDEQFEEAIAELRAHV